MSISPVYHKFDLNREDKSYYGIRLVWAALTECYDVYEGESCCPYFMEMAIKTLHSRIRIGSIDTA